MVLSPITHTSNTVYQSQIDCAYIERIYGRLNIDVSKYFSGLDSVSIFKCLDTGYSFFYPFTIDGDSEFYQRLQLFEWYYMPWKWEHEIAKEYVDSGMKILEVGCGRGEFLSRMPPSVDSIGLELNEHAISNKTRANLDIRHESIQEHCKNNACSYDVVCSFQVLEHIADVRGFIQAKIHALKRGGKLIISVPNNSGFLGDEINPLNLPPHHMGLWDEKSLLCLQDVFPIKLVATHFEPLQGYHKKYFLSVLQKNRILRFLPFIECLPIIFLRYLTSRKYQAYTIQVVFEKH